MGCNRGDNRGVAGGVAGANSVENLSKSSSFSKILFGGSEGGGRGIEGVIGQGDPISVMMKGGWVCGMIWMQSHRLFIS
jgi:hypothetical protein